MKNTFFILLLGAFTLGACNSDRNSDDMQDTADTMDIMDMETDTSNIGMDTMDGTMNQFNDTIGNRMDSTDRSNLN